MQNVVEEQHPRLDPAKGLFRTTLAGPGCSLSDAFSELERTHPPEHVRRHPARDLFGARVALSSDEGHGHWDFARIRDDIFIVVENFAYKEPRVELLPGDGLITFHFRLTGDLTLAVTSAEALRLNRPSLLVYRHRSGTQMSEWTAPGARERSVTINLRPQFLMETFLRDADQAAPAFEALLENPDQGAMQYFHNPLRPQMFEIVTRLVDTRFSGTLGLIHAEALALELLCDAVDGLGTLRSVPNEEYTQRELRCLHAARKVLLTQLTPPPTIRQVARTVGISETSLKRGFKALFGETIFDFSVRCRMEHALTLLREQRMAVNQAAEAVGYSHPTSFATAFRRHFGIRPKDIR